MLRKGTAMKRHSIENQNKRRALYNQLYVQKMLHVVDEKANGKLNPREAVWHCMPLFETGHEKLANSILRHVQLQKCHFMPVQFTEILMRYKDLVEPKTRERMEGYIRDALEFQAGDRIHISMYNDNFANMAIYNLLVAGEMLGLRKYVEIGKQKLSEVCDLFTRCGVLMEYNSPTYTPIDTLCFAEIVNHVQDEEARSMALMCEERMFLEVTAQYHAPSGHMAGPYSRAYSIDSVGHAHLVSGLLWKVFGEGIFINPILDLFEPHEDQVMHGGLEELTLPNIAFITTVDYHCPDHLSDLVFQKAFPFKTEFITECTPSNANGTMLTDDCLHEYSGFRCTNTTYMTEEYSLGCSQSQFHEGAMTESFYITYKNKDEAKRLMDTGVIYSRYIFNEKLPGQANTYQVYGEVNYMGFRDEGRKFCSQDKGTALVVYKPKHYERSKVNSGKLSVMIPSHFFDDFEMYAGRKKVGDLPYRSKDMEPVYVRANRCLFAFSPLDFTDHGRKDGLRIERAGKHIMISFYNYQGPERSFGILETFLTKAGFVCHCGTTEEYPDMEAFMDHVEEGIWTDVMEKSPYAYSRRIKYRNKDTEFCFIYSPVSEGIQVDTVNKRPKGRHVWKVDGIDSSKVPFGDV
ncbi:MAG: hypothetical protein R6W96_08850 [Clostridia bacterium]